LEKTYYSSSLGSWGGREANRKGDATKILEGRRRFVVRGRERADV